jgi:hypothetical protein
LLHIIPASIMAQSIDEPKAAFAVVKTPELLSMILNAVQIAGCARLANTSRLIFNAAAPVVWKNLDTVIPLLDLLQPVDYEGRLKIIVRSCLFI